MCYIVTAGHRLSMASGDFEGFVGVSSTCKPAKKAGGSPYESNFDIQCSTELCVHRFLLSLKVTSL